MKKIIIAIIVLVILGLGAWYFWGTAPTTSVEKEIAPVEELAQVVEEKKFIVEGKNFSFSPSMITVKKGDTVSITLKNVGGTHDLKVEGYEVGTQKITDGQEETFTFVADKVGNFEYYCSIGTHRSMGMKGTLIVEE